VLVRKPYIPEANAVRTRVDLTVDDQGDPGGFNGGTLTIQNGAKVHFFDAQNGGNEVSSFSFTSQALCQVVTLWAEGVSPSDALNDIVLELALSPGSRPVRPPARGALTSVEVTLDIFQSRTDPAADPQPLPAPAGPPAGPPAAGALGDKISPGRFLHAQDTGAHGFHHGRALLIVRKAAPADFPGTLELRAFDANVRLFAAAQEVPANGQASLSLPQNLPNGSIPAEGKRFWVEGVNPSGSLGESGFKLGVAGLGPDGDWAKATVVRFDSLTATIPQTPPQPVQAAQGLVAANGPVNDATLRIPNANVQSPFSETDSVNRALVLITNSIPAGKSVQVDAAITPAAAGPWVRWSVQRDRRSGSGDHADVIAASPNPLPTLTPDAANPLRATFLTDAAGSFHIRPYIDCNGTNQFEHNTHPGDQRIDREPFIILNLILIRIRAHNNISRASANFVTIRPANPTTASGIGVQTTNVAGPWAPATRNRMACYNNASVTVIGGGPQGRAGLDRLFGGWVNNELASPGSISVPPSEDCVAEYLDSSTAPPTVRRRFSFWDTQSTNFTVYTPASANAPNPFGGPFLDVSNFGNEGTGGNRCIGTEGQVGPPVPINKTDLTVGQRWRVEMWDSPGDSAPARHEGFPGTAANPVPITRYRFNLDFRSDLVFWTNYARVAGPTNDAACRLYARVLTNTWSIRVTYTFDPPTPASPGPPPVAAAPGASHRVTQTVTMARDATANAEAGPVEGSGLQVRAPIALRVIAVDARN
jgi:hypothetical protein